MQPKTTPSTARKALMRSPGYPAIPLPEAIEKAKIIWEQEKKHPAPLSALETHWGFKVGSGGVSRMVAALGKYGLLEDEGIGNAKTYKLSDSALEILLAPEGSPERATRIKEAALAPPIFREIWEHYNGELPSDATLESFLLLKKKFNPGVVKNFIQTLKVTMDFASNFVTLGGSASQSTVTSPTQMIAPSPSLPAKGSISSLIEGSSLPVPVGDRIANIPYPVSEEDFDLLINTLKLWKAKIVKKSLADEQDT